MNERLNARMNWRPSERMNARESRSNDYLVNKSKCNLVDARNGDSNKIWTKHLRKQTKIIDIIFESYTENSLKNYKIFPARTNPLVLAPKCFLIGA
jgi:hypothetical protein